MRFPNPGSPGRGAPGRSFGQDTDTLSYARGNGGRLMCSERAPKGPFRLLRKPGERGLDEPWQRAELVAALEHRADAWSQRRGAACQLAEAVLADPHLRER